ncbi:O-antigen ligase [Vibrio splendidus]|uniref:O-antigen ligase family protein n=1 Tax=Vibrio splendidus TaxID=29497 RepID=UPI000C832F10|nr:O-antigen ligase family protein [Vibrio splendidus]PMN78497.1 O-antigen ligase [Vibrio splendidus]PTP07462.1 O-antigen ligase [Vibrio splendidus]PTP23029.1 O-antigen ligase [Vibrio splendidus]
MNIINKNHIYKALLLLPYLFSVTGMLVLDSGDKKLIPFILVSIIISVIFFKKETIIKNLHSPFVWLISLSCIYIIFSYYYHGASSREIRAMISATLFLIVFPYQLLTESFLRTIIAIGGVTVCINSIYFNVYMEMIRDAGYMNPIPYSTTCALLAIVSFSFLIKSTTIKEKFIALISFSLYLPPIMLSQTRGVWLAFSITLIILTIVKLSKSHPTKKQILISIITTLVLSASAISLFKEHITQRYSKTLYEIEKIQSNNYDTSIGLRLQLWALAPEIFKNKPLLGNGQNDQVILMKKLENEEISKLLFDVASTHYHNQYLDRMVRHGTIGLILIIGMLILPLIRLKHLTESEKYIVIGSTSLFFISGLTDVPFNHPQPLMLYLLFLVPICSRCKRVIND